MIKVTIDEQPDKIRLKDLGWALNDLVVDLKTPTDVMALLGNKTKTDIEFMSLSRMCLSALIVNLCKLDDLINHFGKDIRGLSDTVRSPLIQIKMEIESREMYRYRSTYLAHAIANDKNIKRPLTLKEATSYLIKIIDKGLNPIDHNLYAFCDWIYKKDEKDCVVNVIYSVVMEIDTIVGGLGKRE
jgi:hypothetical protein